MTTKEMQSVRLHDLSIRLAYRSRPLLKRSSLGGNDFRIGIGPYRLDQSYQYRAVYRCAQSIGYFR